MLSLRVACFILAGVPVVAGTVHYGWPPPGVPPTLTVNGDPGDTGGVTYIFTNFDLSFGSLYWTVEDVMKPSCKITGLAGPMHYFAFDPDTMTYIWDATSATHIPTTEGGEPPKYLTEFWVQFQDAAGNPIQASDTRSGLGLQREPGPFGDDVPVLQVTGDFRAVMTFVVSGEGIAFNEVCNHTPFKDPEASFSYRFSGEFYGESAIPEPAACTLCGLGLLAAGLIRVRRRET